LAIAVFPLIPAAVRIEFIVDFVLVVIGNLNVTGGDVLYLGDLDVVLRFLCGD
tara:strand:- start:127 stop:285 length:159 start_codon:yes stop_codon:yes gene_type:complete